MANEKGCAICAAVCHNAYNLTGFVLVHLMDNNTCKDSCPYFPNMHYLDFNESTL